MKSTSSSTTKSTSEKTVSQSSNQGQQSNVVISEVNSNMGSVDDGTLKSLQAQYVVTQPEHVQQQAHKPKEHFIFGGTQIVEVGTTQLGSEIAREKNQSTWNGKFVYEGTPKQTTLKTWTKQAVSTDPSTSTMTTTTTKDEFIQSGGTGGVTTKHDVSSESSKLVSDAMKRKADIKLQNDTKVGKDSTDNASSTDLLLESERCIAKKAYVTTNKDEQNTSDLTQKSSTSNIDSQIIQNKSLFDNSKTTTQKSTDTTTGGGRYPVATVPQRPSDIQDFNITSSSLVQSGDTSKRYTAEQFSQSFSTSSRTERASSSNQVIEIVDGKERIVSDSYNESGSLQSKSSQENYKAKYGTDIKPEVVYDQKMAEEKITYGNDKRGKEPIFDRDYRDSHRHIQQTGDDRPVEHLKGSFETTRFDDKTKKYVTDVRHHENNRQLDHTSRITDSIQSKYDIGTSHLNVDSQINLNNQLTHKTDVNTTAFNTKLDNLNASTTYQKNNVSSSASNDFMHTAQSDSIDSKTTTYTSKVFDNKTNTWKVVDESNINETNRQSTTHKPSDIDRRSPTKSIDSTSTRYSSKLSDKNASTDTKLVTDRKTINTSSNNDRRTSIDKTTRTDTMKSMTKTANEKITQHLYDEKSKTWREVDEKTIKSKRPSLIRYVSKDNDGKYTTIYKRKLFDKRSGTWKVVDEKVYKNNNFNEHIPEVIEDVTNCTTTTYTTKVYDTRTNTWRVVDEQTYTDRNTTVPKDIADEIARDQPDIANITTTTELTKVSAYDSNVQNDRIQFDFDFNSDFDFECIFFPFLRSFIDFLNFALVLRKPDAYVIYINVLL